MKNVIEIKNAGFYYNTNKYLFKDLNLILEQGKTLSILGLNGQGKSTLLLCIMGILKLKDGELLTNGKFSFLPQLFSLPFNYSVLDVVLMGRARDISLFSKPKQEDIDISFEALKMLNIDNLSNKNFNELSGGQKQLVLFARSIASKSDVLLLDEPASALDIKNQDRVLTLINDLKEKNNLSIVFTTHQPSHCFSIADYTLIMTKDLKAYFGKTKEIANDEMLTRLYSLEVRNIDLLRNKENIQVPVPIFSTQI